MNDKITKDKLTDRTSIMTFSEIPRRNFDRIQKNDLIVLREEIDKMKNVGLKILSDLFLLFGAGFFTYRFFILNDFLFWLGVFLTLLGIITGYSKTYLNYRSLDNAMKQLEASFRYLDKRDKEIVISDYDDYSVESE